MREYIFVFNLDAIVQDKSGEKNCGILEFINDNAQHCYFKQDCIDENWEKTVVAIGNSESDIAMMEKADIRIGYGGIKEVMPEILSIVDYVIYEEKKLVDFLGRLLQEEKMALSRTVIISCAGMGNRLGLGTTKALLEVDGKTLIVRYLEQLQEEKDVRIVVGYQASSMIEAVLKYRSDVTFVFNHEYQNTGTGASVVLAAKYANEYVLSLDGDLIVHPEDMKKILACQKEFVGGCTKISDDPWMLQTYMQEGMEYVHAFSKNDGNYEWNGVTQVRSDRLRDGTGHVFQLIEPHLPIPFMMVRTREIDTSNDYKEALRWVKNGFC